MVELLPQAVDGGGDDADYGDDGGGGAAVTGQTTEAEHAAPAAAAVGRDADCSKSDDPLPRGTNWTWQSDSSLALPLHCRNIESRGH